MGERGRGRATRAARRNDSGVVPKVEPAFGDNLFFVPADRLEWSALADTLESITGFAPRLLADAAQDRSSTDALVLHIRRGHPAEDVARIVDFRRRRPGAALLALTEIEDTVVRPTIVRQNVLYIAMRGDERELRGRLIRFGMFAVLSPLIREAVDDLARRHRLTQAQVDVLYKHMLGMPRSHLADAYDRSPSATARIVTRLLARCGVTQLSELSDIVWAVALLRQTSAEEGNEVFARSASNDGGCR